MGAFLPAKGRQKPGYPFQFCSKSGMDAEFALAAMDGGGIKYGAPRLGRHITALPRCYVTSSQSAIDGGMDAAGIMQAA
ncbi:MAG: hypothetical protein LBD20_09760 [Spirochaetaceae bacterium]|nr:hypothetical protein [Spirochaetaceae bacterium]